MTYGLLDKNCCLSNFSDDHKHESSSNKCLHPVVLKLICTSCGQKVRIDHGLSFRYIMRGLRLSTAEADMQRNIETGHVLKKKKLILVLDLDETLLHSTEELTPKEKYLKNQIDSSNQSLFKENWGFFSSGFTKLRPYVDTFLEEASTMFEMYVYTLSTESYAKKMVKFLDPDNKYFDSRIIARHDANESPSGLTKNLDVVMGQERAIVILDDRTDVWPKHKDNLIEVQNYKYFASNDCGLRLKSFAERKIDEEKHVMATYLQVLKMIHRQFFDPEANLDTRDVRAVMRKLQGEILQGCRITFGNSTEGRERHVRLRMAQKLGAILVSESDRFDSLITHGVTMEFTPDDDLL